MFEDFKKALHRFIHATGNQIDESTKMEQVGRGEFKYIEGEHAILIDAEINSGKIKSIIYFSTVNNWLPPHENEELTTEDKERILSKVRQHFDDTKISYEIQ